MASGHSRTLTLATCLRGKSHHSCSRDADLASDLGLDLVCVRLNPEELVYWVLTNNPAVKVASLDGSGRATLLNESAAVYTGITLYNDSLYITDENRRSIILLQRQSLLTHEMTCIAR